MMNNTLFSTIVTAITNLDDVQGAQLLSIINGMTNVSGTPNPTTKVSKTSVTPKKSKEFKGSPKDVTVEMTVDKKTVTLGAYTKKDVWEVLKRRFTLMGGTYDKTVKVITFKTQKDAKAFASNNVVTADERQSIWTEWRERA